MKRTLLAAVAVLAIATPALAQSTTVTTTPGGATTVTVTPEQRKTIRQYVTTRKPKAVTIKERVTVGATLPADVELEAVPAEWGPSYGRYRYVYTDGNVVLVEPGTRRVVEIIED